ncbi:ribbon-helix-helix protein, CopG family [Phytohabitans houttuyneae]|uniref:Ribbon-helix-helix protein CopG domain-containing protein n=1 Tax=Phytohabitans houttuyneae TaxID=1076126 RepID=A0A6V8KGF8_9ACTN|nr:hypothetical protein Phou_039750 [Phytohabitans houttuyneae]
MTTSIKQSERLSVNISSTTAESLRELAARNQTSLTEIVRRAVAVLKLLDDEQRAGSELRLVNRKTGTRRQIHIL